MNPTTIISLALIALAAGHGFISQPRMRGAIKTQRAVGSLADENVVGQRGWSYCPHCLNGGGTNRLKSIPGNVANNNFVDYAPMRGAFRNGVSICGDISGSSDFSSSGRFRAPASMPTVATYTAGSVASFEFDITTPHGGFFDFFLCDVSSSGDVTRSSFKNGRCHALQRVENPTCDSGTDSRCGPIDADYPTRWYHPCRVSNARDQDFIVGGGAGTMLYRIPNVAMKKAVVHAYWQTSNNCSPSGLREYFESGVWGAIGNCAGDGGTVGGYRNDHTGSCTTQQGKFPEEFFNCGLFHFTARNPSSNCCSEF